MPKGTFTLSESWLKKDEYKLWFAHIFKQICRVHLVRKRSQIDLWCRMFLAETCCWTSSVVKESRKQSQQISLSALYFTKFDAPSQSNTATPCSLNVAPPVASMWLPQLTLLFWMTLFRSMLKFKVVKYDGP